MCQNKSEVKKNLTEVNFQYIKSYEDPTNGLKMRATPKSQFCWAATNMCFGWGKQHIYMVWNEVKRYVTARNGHI